jgi:hypothetical protein
VERAVTVVRDYAPLAPARYHRPALMLVLAIGACTLPAAILCTVFDAAEPWFDVTMNVFLIALGLHWFIWPNVAGSNPLASRVLGGLMITVALLSLIKFVSRHLI